MTLIPPDKERCQAEKPNGPFRMGGPAYSRCSSRPLFIATERKKGPDGQRGSMSLCATCYAVLVRQLGPKHVTLKPIQKGAAPDAGEEGR